MLNAYIIKYKIFYINGIFNLNNNLNLDDTTDEFNKSLGLSNEVLNEEILEEINKVNDYNHACDKLVLLAKSRGGRDNITVLLFGGEV